MDDCSKAVLDLGVGETVGDLDFSDAVVVKVGAFGVVEGWC